MAFPDEYPNTDAIFTKFFESAGSLKLALADGHITVDELVAAIPDESMREDIRDMLIALSGLPAEMAKISKNPWRMATEFVPMLIARVMAIFK